MKKLKLPNNMLRQLYLERKLSVSQIARTFACSPITVRRRLMNMNVVVRRRGWHFTKKFFPQTIFIPDSPAKLAYFAGIVDGEGTIDFIKNKNRCRKEVAPRLKVGNTDSRLINWLLAEIGGRCYKYHPKNKRHKPCYEWFVSGVQNIRPLLCAVFPYLIIKQKKAKEILNFCENEAKKRG
jgi:hypothetical protein